MDDGIFDCSICQDKLSEATETKCCHHCYCKQCIEDWLTRKNTCPSCRNALTRTELAPNVPIQRLIDNLPGECPNNKRGCTSKLTRGNVKAHVANSCEFVEVLCVNECGITVVKKDLVTHQRQTCSKRLIPCIQCTLMVALDKVPEHISSSCPKTRISCLYCKVLLLRENLSRHHQRECNKIELSCPFSQFGCQFKGFRSNYNTHMIEDSDMHVAIVIEREARMLEQINTLKNELEQSKNNNNKPRPQQDNAVFPMFKFEENKVLQENKKPQNEGFVFLMPQLPQVQPFDFAAPQPSVFEPQPFGFVPPKPAQEQQPNPFFGPNNNVDLPFSFK